MFIFFMKGKTNKLVNPKDGDGDNIYIWIITVLYK